MGESTAHEDHNRQAVQAPQSASQASQPQQDRHSKSEPSLKGTFAAVMLLGGFIAVTWLAVFVLYLARN
ncbi:cytochrome c oxidase subunit 2A [Paenibacillus sp. GCM10012303]|jgi:Ca2+/H+ antiporter|uniref:cytochrome c oxidase subunit 2A n=1 Tax=Paenibacillus sp. GCM10012303 TaxID=3317340 RepID=UPI00360D67F0